tara:strand:+ start:11715 stop:13490 length:1776 start_codon:yes stop_codon:yes gene_type:complete
MADRFPLIIDSAEEKIKELVSGDNLDLTGNSIKNADYIQTSEATIAGIVTATKFKGDGSELDNLPPSGSSLEATASGTLADGSTVIVNTDGTVSAVAVTGSVTPSAASSTEFVADGIVMVHSVFVPSTNQVVVVYRNGSGEGESVVGTVSGTSITFGTPVEFLSTTTSRFSARGLFYDSSTENIILHWGLKGTNMSQYDGDDRLLSAKLGSGNTINWSTGMAQGLYGFEFYGNYSRVGDLDGDTTTGIFQTITRRDQGYSDAHYGIRQWSISADGNTVNSQGSAEIGNITAGGHVTSTPKLVNDGANNRFFIVYTNNSLYGIVRVCTITESYGNYNFTISGTDSEFELGSTNTDGQSHSGASMEAEDFSAVYDSHHDRLVIMYKDKGDSNKTKIIVGTPTTGSNPVVNFGSPQDFSPTNVDSFEMAFDSELNKIIISYRDIDDSNMGKIVKAEVSDSGNSITVESTRLVFDVSNGYNWQNKLDYIPGSNKTVVTHMSWANSPSSSRSLVYSSTSQTTNLTEENFIGISDGAYSDGETATIQIAGAVDDAQSGLTPGQQHYVQADGTLSTTADTPSVPAGTAVAATKLIVRG